MTDIGNKKWTTNDEGSLIPIDNEIKDIGSPTKRIKKLYVKDLDITGTGGGSGSGVTDGDKVDIQVSNSGQDWNIKPNVVENANLAKQPALTLKGNKLGTLEDAQDLTATEVRTLINVANGATANDTDANLKNRANHTGSQTASTISDFQSTVSTNTDVSANTTARHTHANKALLDTYAQTEVNLADAVTKKHTHANQAILDATTASFTTAKDSKLTGIEAGATADQVASEVPLTPVGNLASTNVQAGLQELQSDIDLINTSLGGLTDAVVLKGLWDASVGTFPASGTAKIGWTYIVSVAGTVDGQSFSIGDRILAIANNASTTTFASNWFKLDYTDQVLSVNSQTGAVVLNTDNISEGSTNKYVTVTEKTKLSNLSGTNTGDQTITLTGDVTGSGTGSFATTIGNGVVSLAKMSNLANATIIGRITTGTGVPEALTTTQVKTLLNLTGTNSGDQTISLTGDVTGSGTGTFSATIANGVVSLAKLANVATGTIFYRKTAGTGSPEVQTLATLKTDLGLTGTNSGDQDLSGLMIKANNLSDLTNTTTARTNLGLGTLAIQNGTFSGTSSGTNTGDQTSIVGITGTKAQFDTACTDGNFLYVGDVTSNATHTGEITGSTALTLDKTAITNKTSATVASGDLVLIADVSDSNNLKQVTAQSIANLAVGSGITDIVQDTTPQLGGNLDTNGFNIDIDNGFSIRDENGNEQIKFETTASAVNEITVKNSATGNNPVIKPTGGDANISLSLTAKGTGNIRVNDVLLVSNNSGSVKMTAVSTDGADNKSIDICGGGDNTKERGARVVLFGNESGQPGNLFLDAGNVSGSQVIIRNNDNTIFSIAGSKVYSQKPLVLSSGATEPSSEANTAQLWYGTGGRPRWKDTNNYNHFQVQSFTPADPTVPVGTITGGSKGGEYCLLGDICYFSMQFANWTLSNSTYVVVTPPFTPTGGIRKAFACNLYDGAWKTGKAYWDGSGTQIYLTYFDNSNIPAGSGRWFMVTGCYPI